MEILIFVLLSIYLSIYDCVTHVANSYKFYFRNDETESESNTSTSGETDRDIFKESQLILIIFPLNF